MRSSRKIPTVSTLPRPDRWPGTAGPTRIEFLSRRRVPLRALVHAGQASGQHPSHTRASASSGRPRSWKRPLPVLAWASGAPPADLAENLEPCAPPADLAEKLEPCAPPADLAEKLEP